ncbi:DUF6665 family protein [Henriciella mobilis]|uniref:Uncharacterized protein n=1 Tax=Henriciella mobilis TaxID=2305467 RepID=A0A399R9U8_9PROT|nr:hypothetical protein D1223_14840 [Henriciella mobilis]
MRTFTRVQSAEAKSSLEAEVAAEKAAALGRAGRAIETALLRLEYPDDQTAREDLLLDAAEAVQAYFLQRELNGLRDQRDIIQAFAIPRAVLNRIGIVRRRPVSASAKKAEHAK